MHHITTLVAALALTPALLAGPLDPPAGPIAPTNKPLAQVEPRTAITAANTPGDADSLFKITQPGSYYLTGNVTGVIAKHGIEIASSGVTIDLAGFELLGVAGSLNGIAFSGTSGDAIDIHGGSIRNWGANGVGLNQSGVGSAIIRAVRATNNGAIGIAAGTAARVGDCTASGNASDGITIGAGSTIANCTAHDNGSDGIDIATACTATACTSYQNANDGFECGTSSTVTSCTAYDNGATGINAITSCTITSCSSSSNTQHGIRGVSGCTITGNMCRSNDMHGILGVDACLVQGNTCTNNGVKGQDGSGIRIDGSGSRVEGNVCVASEGGIYINAGGNIVIRNTCSGNTINWLFAANNHWGPVINVTTIATPQWFGDANADALGSTHPNANFTY